MKKKSKRKSKTVEIFMDDETLNRLKRIAQFSGESTGAVIRILLAKYIIDNEILSPTSDNT
jgi:predicted DNA-binding protein